MFDTILIIEYRY